MGRLVLNSNNLKMYFLFLLLTFYLLNPFSSLGDGLLAIACWHCREETAAMLISEFKMDVNARNHQGSTPLHRASAGGDLNCAHLLLEKGAESFLCDKNGKRSIDVAASHEMV